MMRNIARGIVVHERRVRRERLIHRQHGWKHLVLDFDQIDCSARCFGIERRDRCHFVADIAHLVDGGG